MRDPEGGGAGHRQRGRGKGDRQPCGKMRKEAWGRGKRRRSPQVPAEV